MSILPLVERARTRREPLDVLELDDPRWLAFVNGCAQATAFHLPAWVSTVADCYGFSAFVLASTSPSGSVTGGMPVVAVSQPWSRWTRSIKWVALPFTDYCPPLFPPNENPRWVDDVRASLVSAGVAVIQIRAEVPGATTSTVGVRHVLDLEPDPDAMYRRFHRSQVQRNIRRAEREGVAVRNATDETDLTEIFYRLHLMTRCRQGVPVQPRRFFRLIWERLIARGHGSVLIAEHRGVPIAAAVFLRHNGTVIYKFGASDAHAWSLRPNHALFWQAIRTAASDGDRYFDWGRSDLENRGLREFKSSWGSVEEPLRYTTLTASAARAPVERDLGASSAAHALGAVIRHSPPWTCIALGEALYRFTA